MMVLSNAGRDWSDAIRLVAVPDRIIMIRPDLSTGVFKIAMLECVRNNHHGVTSGYMAGSVVDRMNKSAGKTATDHPLISFHRARANWSVQVISNEYIAAFQSIRATALLLIVLILRILLLILSITEVYVGPK